jgi:hypothetical protein
MTRLIFMVVFLSPAASRRDVVANAQGLIASIAVEP